MDREIQARARQAIGLILSGQPPNGTMASELGEYGEAYAEIERAYLDQGASKAKQVAEMYCNRDPAFAFMMASDPAPHPGGPLGDQWQVRTLANAYQERPPLLYLVDGLLPCPSLSIAYGPPGGLKTMLLGDLAVCVAGGMKWLETLPSDLVRPGKTFLTTAAPVLWIDFDNGTRRTDERFDALGKARNLPASTPLHYVSMPKPWLDASDRSMVNDLGLLITHLGAKLVVIDNLGVIVGKVEENNAAMANVMGNLRWLVETHEIAVAIIHHQRKMGNGSDQVRKGETIRGHSSIEAALDLALLIERKEGEDIISATPTKVRGYRAVDLLSAHFTYTHKDGTNDLAEARFFSAEVESKQSKEQRMIEDAALAVLKQFGSEHPKQKDLLDKVKGHLAVHAHLPRQPGVNLIRGIFDTMVTEGKIIAERGDKQAIFYALP